MSRTTIIAGILCAGLAGGLVAALAATKFIAGFLYGLRPTDPGTFLLAAAALPGHSAEAQANPAPKAPADLPVLESNTFKPGPPYGSLPKHVSHHYLLGMLQAGNIRLEMHETTQDPGAVHEPTETHLHSEIWLVREGVAELYINGVIHRMEAGDVGLVCAGDKHWVRNGGDTQVTYFVVTVGPPEPAKA